MKINIRTTIFCIIGSVLLTVLMLFPAAAQEKSKTDAGGEPIRISADSLLVDSDARYAEFSGNVRAVQGNTDIASDSLRIYYKSAPASDGKPSGDEDAIDRIIAKGHVVIRFDNRVAESDRAEYAAESRILTLSGDNSRITSGNDSITGAKIIFDRISGKITVEGGAKPVEAILYSGPKGIQ